MQCVCVTVCLRYALESDAVRPLRTPRSPMDRACKAPLMTLGEEELARHLLLQTLPRDVAVRKIIIQRLRYRDEDLCTIVSEGVDPLSLQCSQENNSTEDFDGTYLPLNLLIYPFTKWIETYYQSAY